MEEGEEEKDVETKWESGIAEGKAVDRDECDRSKEHAVIHNDN